ncbi:hypothetical protein WEU38_14045 [Cyanobacterium aponinum AL20118]|uniref:Uncharacterized protein n=1 Tax=Cyanobacterium aponinum AL20115 TaxID=3090662 RepID=A0AAF0Z9B9_9CHRO|nr:hypothetical protein [Cyanobacterium aponinum]WPF87921.1 hypothetical protein SAY89_14115 [Cyanobacterium aponinum AL20115]
MNKSTTLLWDNLYENGYEKQKNLLDKILKPEREQLKLLLENLHDSGYEISFQRKKDEDKINKGTLRITKRVEDENIHCGYINQHALDENSLFGYCLGFKSDKCPDNFSNQIYGFSQDNELYPITIEGSDQGWYLVEGKRKDDKDKRYVLITSIELAHKIFNLSK